MFRIFLPLWLLGQTLVSAGTLEFTEAERMRVNSAVRFGDLVPALRQRVADNTLAWMTQASSHVLACWVQFGGRGGVIAEPKPPAALLRQTRETCASALQALSADAGPSPRTADMLPAISEFQQASRAVVDSAIRALETGIGEAERNRAVAQFNAYYRTLETGRLPVWMLGAATSVSGDPGAVRRA